MGLFGKGWFRKLFRVVVTAVATSINPFLGGLVAAGFAAFPIEKSFSENDSPFVQNEVTKWTNKFFSPYILKATQIFTKDKTDGIDLITHKFQVGSVNLFLMDLAILKVYYSYKAGRTKGDQHKIYNYKSEIVDFFIQEFTKGYFAMVKQGVTNGSLQKPDLVAKPPLELEKVQVTASDFHKIDPFYMDWEGNKVVATYYAFKRDQLIPIEDRPIDIPNDFPIDDPIPVDLPDVFPDNISVSDQNHDLPPIFVDGDVIITDKPDGSGVVVGGSGSNTTTDNGTVEPSSKFPWWIVVAGGLVSYYIIKKPNKKKG
ncbi:hypothetical protein [Aquimarina litoralis]|uniref:hypothetical protein n=1 Tax=Aquimarina litoralis TaxID=584605 RepID=UPI001C581125|nr:hypothetical protein [Aquimarina litoralis]MBW1296430.1 hypothetical protein [Aquimarina litoralis]